MQLAHGVRAKTRYTFECYDKHGKLKWVDGFDNLVVTTGLNELLTRLVGSVPANVNWYVGLKGAGSAVAGDTMASHAGWSEIAAYSQANRPAFTPGSVAAGSVDNSASKAAFSINGSATVAGAFLTSNNTISGSTGTLYGAGDFASARDVENGDTLNVTVTLSVSAS